MPTLLKCKARWVLVEHHGVNSLFAQKKGISVERIPFDAAHWETLKLKLNTYMYYFNHFIKTAATKLEVLIYHFYFYFRLFLFYDNGYKTLN